MAEEKKTKAKAEEKLDKPTSSKAPKKKPSKESTGEVQAKAAAPKKANKPTGAPAAKRAPLARKTFFAKPGQFPSRWRLIDATNIPLGRLSTQIAKMLMGKDKPEYTRSAMTGDQVVVINASRVLLTGNKFRDKTYHYHTQYPGGIKSATAREVLAQTPDRVIKWAVWGMLPKGHMGREWFKNLRVYAGEEHPHTAQKPEPVKLTNIGVWEKA